MMWPLVQYVLGNCAAFSVDVWEHQLGRFGKLFAHTCSVWFLDRVWHEWSISAPLDQCLYIFVSINWLTCRKSTKIRKIVHSIGPERKFFLALFILSTCQETASRICLGINDKAGRFDPDLAGLLCDLITRV